MDDYYSSISEGYDELHGEEQDVKLQQFLSRVNISPDLKLLDVGCGTGRSFSQLSCDWYGLDPSPGLIAKASDQARSRIKQGVAEKIPFEPGTFDVVLSLTALQNFDDAEVGCQEMLRVCKPGGRILLSFLKKSPKADELRRIIETQLNVVDSWEHSIDLMFICEKV